MRLWTWQNQKFDITDPNMRVDSKKYSKYQYPNEYKKLWTVLGTDQFHWYYTDKEEATNSCSLVGYKGNALWELAVPEERFLASVCGMAWHWILKNSDAQPPRRFEYLLDAFWLPTIYDRKTFLNDFNKPWQDMKSQQLWDCLITTNCKSLQCQCDQVLIHHPVDASWVIENPLKNKNWWQKYCPINNHQHLLGKR